MDDSWILKLKKKKVNSWLGTFLLLTVFCLVVFSLSRQYLNVKKEERSMAQFADRLAKRLDRPRTVLKISFLTDAHSYASINKITGEVGLNYRFFEPVEKLSILNQDFLSDFLIDGGDLIEGNRDRRGEQDFIDALALIKEKNPSTPFYQVLGNHELRALNKKRWLELTGRESTYYYFDVREYRVVVLDGNFSPPSIKTGEEPENNGEVEYIPGQINREQIVWLKKLLARSGRKEVLVFLHQPISWEKDFPPNATFLSNSREVAEIFQEYKVKYVFSGHREQLCNFSLGETEFYLFKGFSKGDYWIENGLKHKSFFYQLTVDGKNGLKARAFYRPKVESKEFVSFEINKEDYGCMNRLQMTKEALAKKGETLKEMEKEND